MKARRRLVPTLLLLGALGVGASNAQDPPPATWNPGAGVVPVHVVFRDGDRAPLTLDGRRLCEGTDLPYLAAADMASLVRAGRFWRDASMSLRLSVGGSEAVFTHGSRLVRLDARDVLLPVPPYAQEGDLWLPVVAAERVLSILAGEAFAWDPASSTLTVGGRRANITGLRVETSGRSTRLALVCSRALRWSLERPASDRVRLTVRGGVLERGLAEGMGAHGLVRSVRAVQEDGRAVLDIAVLPLTSDVSAVAEDGGRTIVLSLAEGGSGLPAPPIRGSVSMASPDVFAVPPRAVRRIVLDPGHGGDDAGVSGPDGRHEKDLVLDLARDLKDLLENAGFDVVMTRGGDDGRGPDERAERANLARGDLFLSLHAGAWFGGGRRGATAWILPRRAAGGAGDFARWETVQQRHLERSAQVAETLLARLSLDAAWPVRPLARAELPVLLGVDMPAVLLEAGLLTHDADAATLADDGGRRRLAAALANAVKAYRAAVDAELNAGGEEER